MFGESFWPDSGDVVEYGQSKYTALQCKNVCCAKDIYIGKCLAMFILNPRNTDLYCLFVWQWKKTQTQCIIWSISIDTSPGTSTNSTFSTVQRHSVFEAVLYAMVKKKPKPKKGGEGRNSSVNVPKPNKLWVILISFVAVKYSFFGFIDILQW